MSSLPIPNAANPQVRRTSEGPQGRPQYDLYIGGEFVAPADGRYFETTDPVTGEVWADVARGSEADVDAACRAAQAAFENPAWRGLSASARGALMRRLGDLITENADWLAAVEMKDNGKLIAELGNQMRYMANYYYYYGGLADKIEGSTIPTDKPGVFNFTRYEPIGVVACIMPWNSPLPLTSLKLAPALAAGNTVVLKPSEFTSASLLEFVKLVELAGFPKGVVNVVTGFGHEMGNALVSHPLVERIAFTGGPEAGRIINEQAARSMKRVTMELGGKSPNIILEDAHLGPAVAGSLATLMMNSGQSCLAPTRMIAPKSKMKEIIEIARNAVEDWTPGDPATAKMGPVVSESQWNKIQGLIEKGVAEGATVITGGLTRGTDTATNAKFRFTLTGLLSFGGLAGQNYWVWDHAPDYSWAIMGLPDKSNWWIWHRSASPSASERSRLVARAGQLGFNTSRTVHTGR